MKRALWKPVWVVILALWIISLSVVPALAKKGATGTDIKKLRHDIQKLSHYVEKLIKTVEHSSLACQTRNSVVRRLRKLDDALRSGNLSAAQAFVQAWREHAWSQQAARVIGPELGSSLQKELGGLVGQIPIGTPIALATWLDKPLPTKKWKPLPACDSCETSTAVAGLAATAASSSNEFDSEDVLIIVKTALMFIPEIGHLLAGITEVFWPESGETDVGALIDKALDDYTETQAHIALNGLRSRLSAEDGYQKDQNAWWHDCKGVNSDQCNEGAQSLYVSWDGVRSDFVGARIQFQTADTDNQLMLLPVFAQYETLYMSFLRDGVLLAPYWLASGKVTPSQAAFPAEVMAQELDPNFVSRDSVLVDTTGKLKPDRGIAYVNGIYKMGLDQQPLVSQGGWTTRNAYIRNKILGVLDFRDTWKYMDPHAYPDGVPGGVKLTRMIYSDNRGYLTVSPEILNVTGPLKELTLWTRPIYANPNINSYYAAIDAVQATNPPLLGPAQSGAITGDTAQPRNGTPGSSVNYYDLNASGPIVDVKTYSFRYDNQHHHIPSYIGFTSATGGYSEQGFSCSTSDDRCGGLLAFHYDGEVLATVQAIGTYNWSFNDTGAKGSSRPASCSVSDTPTPSTPLAR